MTSYTPILNIPQVASNQNQKETTINTGLAILEGAANDTLAVDLSSADHALSEDEFTKYFSMKCSGNTVARNLDTPAASGSYSGKRVFVVENTGTFAITVRPGGAATGNVTVDVGVAALLKCDGIAISTLSSGAAAVTGATFTSLSDVPNAYTGDGLEGVRVKSDATGLEFYPIPATQRAEFRGVPAASAQANIAITENWKLAAGLGSSVFWIGVNPTATLTLTINKISGGTTTAIGTVAFATTGASTITFTADVSFAIGDILQIVAPVSPDTTGANIAMAFRGQLQ